MAGEYSKEEKIELLRIARNTIRNYLEHKKEDSAKEVDNEKYLQKRGVFVTLHIEGNLRGCIGYPLPNERLINAVMDKAISAAFQDPRFPPLSKNELDSIDLEISVLTVPREIKELSEIQVGRDGIIISKGFFKGLFLPQVPVEQNWNLEQYISHGCLKAGLSADEWKKKKSGIEIQTFQAEVFGEKELGIR